MSPILKVDSTRSMRKSVRWSTAFHEAGHAVASWRHGLKVHSATIVPTAEFQGLVVHDNPLHGLRLKWDDSARAQPSRAIGDHRVSLEARSTLRRRSRE